MKLKLILLLVLSFSYLESSAQNQFSVYYGITDSELLRNEELVGGGDTENQNSYEYGVKYLRKLSNQLSVETGVNIFDAEVKITPTFTGIPVNAKQEDLKLVSIPLYVNYSFGKYFYVNGGPMLDFQHGDKSFDSQSGIGYGIGVGIKYHFNDFLIYMNPNFKRHSTIPFNKERYHQKLTQFGLQIGLGYEF